MGARRRGRKPGERDGREVEEEVGNHWWRGLDGQTVGIGGDGVGVPKYTMTAEEKCDFIGKQQKYGAWCTYGVLSQGEIGGFRGSGRDRV